MANRFIIEKALILDKALDMLSCVLNARTASARISCAAQLIALADALGVDRRRPPSYTLVDSMRSVLRKLGVEVKRSGSLDDALQIEYSSILEVDLYVKALIVASSVIAVAATAPIAHRDLSPLA